MILISNTGIRLRLHRKTQFVYIKYYIQTEIVALIMSYTTNLHYLKRDIKNGKQIVLFLGAGVNFSPNVKLLWEDIINPLMEIAITRIACNSQMPIGDLKDLYDVFEIHSSIELESEMGINRIKQNIAYEYSPQIKAMLVKTILGDQYIASFQNQIYSQCNRTILKKSFVSNYKIDKDETYKSSGDFYTLYTIARMILLNPHIRAVVTYNYDNFLTHAVNILQDDLEYYFSKKEVDFIEERIKRQGNRRIKIIDIHGEARPDVFETGIIFAYHPHGYIPSPNESDNLDDCQIIMSTDEYCDNTSKVYSWDNDTQVHLLSHYTCLFVGSSISDLTTQRMLHYAKANGNKNNLYNLSAMPTFSQTTYSNRCQRIRRNLSILQKHYYKACGLTNLFCPNGYNQLFRDLNEINSEYCNELMYNWQINY